MVTVQASHLNLYNPALSSLLFEPSSFSLAFYHSDSSISLYPPLSFFPTSLPASYTQISAPSTSAAFLLLQSHDLGDRTDNSSRCVLFVVAGPYAGGSGVRLRLYALRRDNKGFASTRIVCSQKGIVVDRKSAVLLDEGHGVSVRLIGSINYFALQSVSSSRILIFAIKLVDAGGDNDGVVVVKLMRCAVIECSRPVWSVCISSGFLVLGEENGIRILNLRELVKGRKNGKAKNGKARSKAKSQLQTKRARLPNGTVKTSLASDVKQKESKYRQESGEAGACYVALKKSLPDDADSKKRPPISIKAISIRELFSRKYLILDSAGDLYLLHVSNPIVGSTISCQLMELPQFVKVHRLLALPELSSRTRSVWISDGDYTLHMMTFNDQEDPADDKKKEVSSKIEKKKEETGEMPVSSAVTQTILVAERVQDFAPFPDNGIMILCRGSLYSYKIT